VTRFENFRQPHLYRSEDLDEEQQFSRKIMEFWGRFAKTGEPVDFWPKYNRITRKSLVLSRDIIYGSAHSRLYIDVHGRFCRLLDEAQTVARNEIRVRQTSMSLSTRAAASSSVRNSNKESSYDQGGVGSWRSFSAHSGGAGLLPGFSLLPPLLLLCLVHLYIHLLDHT